MKQLLFHFMFFVASSLFFIQCAKLFPTVDNQAIGRPAGNFQLKKMMLKRPGSTPSFNHISFINTKLRTEFVWPFFSAPIFNHNIFNNLNTAKLFNQPYINLAYDKLVSDVQNNDDQEKQ